MGFRSNCTFEFAIQCGKNPELGLIMGYNAWG